MADTSTTDYAEFDTLLEPNGPAVLIGKQLLKVGVFDDEKTAVVFPPSYANPSEKKDDPPVYNIDPPYDATNPLTHNNVCVLDSIPSQANRIEPLFGVPPYDTLVPQYDLKFNDELPIVNITQIGHRLADAALRGTVLRDAIVSAFKEYSRGNAVKMAKIGPTSLVFGAWDSRGTGVKVPRLINSIVRAFNVRPIRRSAQYTPPIKYEQEGLIPSGLEGKPADHGLADVPSSHKIGGVQVFGEIRRDFSLNLELLREIRGATEEETAGLQRYILSLSLLAFAATQKTTLRQGCQLLPDGEPMWKLISANGAETPWTPSAEVTAFARFAAARFGVTQPDNRLLEFDKNLLKASIDADNRKKADKKAENFGDPIDNLRNLVNGLEPAKGDKFSTTKKAPLTKLREAVAAIIADSSVDDSLQLIATGIEPLLSADAGAAERKQQMLALFPAASDSATTVQSDQSTGDAE